MTRIRSGSADSRIGSPAAPAATPPSRLAAIERVPLASVDPGVELRVAALESLRLDQIRAEQDVRVQALQSAVSATETLVEDLWIQLAKLSSTTDHGVFDTMSPRLSVAASPSSASAHVFAGLKVDGPKGHGSTSITRDSGHGSVMTLRHIPANGKPPDPASSSSQFVFPPPPPLSTHPPPSSSWPSPFRPQLFPYHRPPPTFPPPNPQPPHPYIPNTAFASPPSLISSQPSSPHSYSPNTERLPKLHFARFDGDNPHLWRSRAEKYFAMYAVPESMWISVAEMHLDGPAALWFQSIESQIPNCSWLRFDRDQKELLIRQLFHIRQTSSIADYVKQFSELIDQLSAYSSNTDPMYFTMRFIDGLRPDIKSIVLVMRPQTLDAASTIALLQEEATGNSAPLRPGVVIGLPNFGYRHHPRCHGRHCPCLRLRRGHRLRRS